MKARCQFCTNEFDMPAERCPHCAEACPFANVWAASRAEDVAALERRYQTALDDAKLRGCDAVAQDFATALDSAKVVIARHIHDVERLGFSDSECYTTFHQALDGGLRVPDGDEWNELRRASGRPVTPSSRQASGVRPCASARRRRTTPMSRRSRQANPGGSRRAPC
jgi:hypothetical protein